MSKKISQLTKVIHHLNSKDGDRDFDMQSMAGEYESEIEQILRDAADRVNAFKQQLETKREDNRIQEVVKELQAQHDAARQEALAQFEAYKQRTKDAETALHKAAEMKMNALTGQVDTVRQELQQRMAELNALKESNHSSSEAQRKALALAKRETEEAVKKGNKQFNAMLAERMGMEDDLRQQLEALQARLQTASTDNSSRAKEIGAERKQWDAQRSALVQERQQADAAWRLKVDRLLEELESEKENGARAVELAEEREQTVRQLSEHKAAMALRLDNAEASLQRKTDELSGLAKSLRAAEAQVDLLKDDLLTAQQEVQRNAQRAQRAEDTAEATHTRLEKLQATFDAEHAEWRQQHTESTSSAARQRAHLQDQLAAALAGHRTAEQRLQKCEKELATATDELAKTRESNAQLVSQLTREQSAAGDKGQQVRTLEAELSMTREQARADFAAAKAAAAAELQAKLAAAASQFERKLDEERGQHEQAQQELRQQMREAIAAAERHSIDCQARLQDTHQQAMRRLEGQHAEALGEAEQRATAAREEGQAKKQHVAELERQLRQVKQELGEMRGQKDQLEMQIREQADSASSSQQTLSNQLAAARAKQAALETQMREEAVRGAVAAKVEQYQAEMRRLKETIQEQGSAERAQMLQDFQQAQDKLNAEWATKVDNLSQLHERSSQARQAEAKAARQDLVHRHQAETEAAAQHHQAELATALEQQASEFRQALEEAVTRHKADLAAANARLQAAEQQHTQQLQATVADWTATLASTKEHAQHTQRVAATAADKRQAQACQELQRGYEAQLGRLRDDLAAAQRSVQTMQSTLADLTSAKQYVESKCATLQAKLGSKTQELQDTVGDLNMKHAAASAAAEVEHKSEVEAMAEDHEAAISALQDEMAAAAAQAASQYNQLNERFTVLSARFDARESRAEDLELIAELDATVKSQAGELRLLEERLAQMRGELLLREENYNKTFSNGGAGEKALAVDKALNAQQGVVDWMLKSSSKKKLLEEQAKNRRTTSFKAAR
ncbi:hypothetical protein WJX72_009243 [[Myrmecia] bisecta]|uniref:Protein FAM184A/B N-terminal domain-containing protein n=1 Tax=[Myrmecia] bisecta TaxID=41462 RepID=A0AAW1PPL7_9CHLO